MTTGGRCRLRRDLKGFLAGWTAEGVILVLAVLLAVREVARGDLVSVAVLGGVFAFVFLLAYSPSRVYLEDDRLDAGYRLARRPPRRVIVLRQDVYRAEAGGVLWGRGGYHHPGIRVITRDGTEHQLPLSAYLGDARRRVWIQQINTWAADAGSEASRE